MLLLSACGGGGSGSAEFTVGGTVTGLNGSLVLRNNGSDPVTVSSSGRFDFSVRHTKGTAYSVTVGQQPDGQACTVTHGTGTLSANVTDIAVSCVTLPLTLTDSTPDHHAVDVEPRGALTLNFSATLAQTPPAEAVVSLAAAGREIGFSASYSGNQLVILPSRPLPLLTSHSLDVGQALHALGGGTLAAPWVLNFTTRDGSWRPATVLATAVQPELMFQVAAMDPDGNTFVVWRQLNGTRYDLWGNRYVPGTGWGTAARIELDNSGDVGNPQLAVDAQGHAIALWTQRGDVWANRFTPGGGWGVAQLIDSASGRAAQLRLSMNAAGDAVAVWQQHDGSFDDDIWSSRYIVGSGWGVATRVEGGVGDADNPSVFLAGSGDAFAVWEQFAAGVRDVWASQFVPGSGWEAPVLLETGAGDASSPEIVVDQQGNAIAAWMHYNTAHTRADAWASRFVSGSGWTDAVLIESGTGSVGDVEMAMDGDGNALAVFNMPDGTANGIWANRYDAATGWGEAERIEDSEALNIFVRVAFDDWGNAVAVWIRNSDTGYKTFAKRFRTSSGTWGADIELETSGGAASTWPSIAVGAGGVAHAFWQRAIVINEEITQQLSERRFD